jgi:demethylmenaquinone methyltransferase/2-methoxy-6-polyprenyl-1,4-benzoquinol methylase
MATRTSDGSAGQALPQGEDKVRAVRSMFDTIAPRYDLVNRVMTFGLDRGWRRRTVGSLGVAPGSLILDAACGTGDLCAELTRSGHRPLGVDLSFGMLAHARFRGPLVQADTLRLPLPDGRLDGAVSGFALRNLVGLGGFFEELARVIRPGGRIALLDVAQPVNPVLRWGHGVYFSQVVPRIGGLLSDGDAYSYLPRSVAYLPPAAELLAQLAGSGFASVRRQLLSGGITQLITATREGR